VCLVAVVICEELRLLHDGAVPVVNTRDMAEFSEKPTCQSLNTGCTLLSFDTCAGTCEGLAYHDWRGNLWFIVEVQTIESTGVVGRRCAGFFSEN
jgi:hypothetical protein